MKGNLKLLFAVLVCLVLSVEPLFVSAQTTPEEMYNKALECQREKDHSQAVQWYLKSAAQGYAMAQYNLGVCYDEGKGVERNREEAVIWWIIAAYQCGILDFSQARYWFGKSAAQGYEAAKQQLKEM